MDFRHLRAFIAVAEEASVTKAAERLHISQPPLSRHIRQLEDELGMTLFVRHRLGVTLTEGGRQLLEKARVLASAASDFYEAAGLVRRDDSNKVRVGISWGLWDAVNRVRVECTKQFANVTIEAGDVGCLDQCSEQLRSRALDIVFGRPPFDTSFLNTAPLFQERILVALSEDHPLASRKSLRIRDLAAEPLLLWDRSVMPAVYDKILDLYARAQVTPKTIATPGAGPHTHAGMLLVASGKGIYLHIGLPLNGPRRGSGVAVVPLADADAASDVCIAWRKNETSPMVQQFLNCVWHVFPQERRAAATTARPRTRRAS
jgi:DNA-binding transcriptional LysR family regulator